MLNYKTKTIFMRNGMKRRIKHNDLTHYFLRPHSELPQAYLASCEKFFKSLKQQAASGPAISDNMTRQAANSKLDNGEGTI